MRRTLACMVLVGCGATHGADPLDAGSAENDASSPVIDAAATDAASSDAASSDAASPDAAPPSDAGPALGVAITANCNPTEGGSFVLSIQPNGPACEVPLAAPALIMEVADRLWPTNPPGRVYRLGGSAPTEGNARYCRDATDPATCIALTGTLTVDAITTGPLLFHYDLSGADGSHVGSQPEPYLWCMGVDTCPSPGI